MFSRLRTLELKPARAGQPEAFDHDVTHVLAPGVPVVRSLRYVEGKHTYGVEGRSGGGLIPEVPDPPVKNTEASRCP